MDNPLRVGSGNFNPKMIGFDIPLGDHRDTFTSDIPLPDQLEAPTPFIKAPSNDLLSQTEKELRKE